MNAYKYSVGAIENNGHPQPKDHSFRVLSWHIPFATWNSPFTFKNPGHYYEDFLRWQVDAGRLLHGWTIGGHLDLMHGEVMWLPAGVAESLARWFQGLPGMTFLLVPSSAFDYSYLRLSTATRRIMLEEGIEIVKAVRDPQADLRAPVVPRNIFVPALPPIRKLVAVPASQQPHLQTEPTGTQVSPQRGTNKEIQVQRGNRPTTDEQMFHPPRTYLAGTHHSTIISSIL